MAWPTISGIRQIESQTKSNPVLYGRHQILAAFFLSLASCPDAFQIKNFAVERLFIIYDLVDSLGDRSLDVLEEHAEENTLPEDITLSESFGQDNSKRARLSRTRLPGGPRLAVSRQSHSLGGAVVWRGLAELLACSMTIGEQKGQIEQG